MHPHLHHPPVSKRDALHWVLSVALRDLTIETFIVNGIGAHGSGSKTGVRVRHLASGAVGESRRSDNQQANKQDALWDLADSREFRAWVAAEHSGMITEETTGGCRVAPKAPDGLLFMDEFWVFPTNGKRQPLIDRLHRRAVNDRR